MLRIQKIGLGLPLNICQLLLHVTISGPSVGQQWQTMIGLPLLDNWWLNCHWNLSVIVSHYWSLIWPGRANHNRAALVQVVVPSMDHVWLSTGKPQPLSLPSANDGPLMCLLGCMGPGQYSLLSLVLSFSCTMILMIFREIQCMRSKV